MYRHAKNCRDADDSTTVPYAQCSWALNIEVDWRFGNLVGGPIDKEK